MGKCGEYLVNLVLDKNQCGAENLEKTAPALEYRFVDGAW